MRPRASPSAIAGSIIDLSATGHQPMTSACGRYVITYNGEIYNFREVRQLLEQRGHRFRGHSDTEVLLAATTEWGIEQTLPRLHGMFALRCGTESAPADPRARPRRQEAAVLRLVRQNVPVRVELKALHRHPAFDGAIDRDALGLLVQLGWVPGPYSIYRGIRKLPPGALLSVDADGGPSEPAIETFWSAKAAAEAGDRAPFRAASTRPWVRWTRCLAPPRARMIADVPLGALLSGGVDLIRRGRADAGGERAARAHLLDRLSRAEARRGAVRRAIAAHLGTDHTELYVGPEDGLALVPGLPEMYDEPFADPSQIPTALVCRLARKDVTVALSGDGGDELFAGYQRYRRTLDLWRRLQPWPAHARRAVEELAERWMSVWRAEVAAQARQTPPASAPPMRSTRSSMSEPDRGAGTAGVRRVGVPPSPGRSAELAGRARAAAGDDVSGFRRLFARRLPGQGRPGEHGGEPRGALPAPRPPGGRAAWSLPLPTAWMTAGPSACSSRCWSAICHAPCSSGPSGLRRADRRWLRGPLRGWAETLLDQRRMAQEGYLQPAAVRDCGSSICRASAIVRSCSGAC